MMRMGSPWLGQAAIVPIETYEVGNILKDISSFRKNGPQIQALFDLAKNDTASFDQKMGSDGTEFAFYASDAEALDPLIAQFEKDFYPPGVRNKITETMQTAIDDWLRDQGKLAELISGDHSNAASGAGSPADQASAVTPYVVGGAAALLIVIGISLFLHS